MLAALDVDSQAKPPYAFRDVLGEIVQKRLANADALAEVFPGYTDWKMRGMLRV